MGNTETYLDYGIHIPRNKTSGEIVTGCPKCAEDRKKKKNKSLGINLEGGYWHCCHCEWKGRLKNIKHSYQPMKPTYVKPVISHREKAYQDCLTYLAGRGISADTAKAMGLTGDYDWMPEAGQGEKPTLHFNYFLDKELINVKYRSIAKKSFKLAKDAEMILYNLDAIKDSDWAIITEGEMGAVTWHEAGFPAVVSVPNGVPLAKAEKEQHQKTGKFSDENVIKMEYLDNCWERVSHIQKWYIATDNDVPGRKLARELARRLGTEKCYLINFGEFKDENELLMAKGKQALSECYLNATSSPIEGVTDLEDEWAGMQDQFRNGRQKGLSMGITEFNNHYSIRMGELDIINGYPGDGKTSFVSFMMVMSAVAYGLKWAVYSPENYPVGDLYEILIEIFVGKSADKSMGSKQMSDAEYKAGKEFISQHFFILDPDSVSSLDDVLARFSALVKQRGVNAGLIDPWNDLTHFKENGEREDEYLQRQLRKIREFKRKNMFKFVINAHPVTNREKDSEGKRPVPTAYHLAGGAMWYNRADNIMTVYRRRTEGESDCETEVHVQKVKFHKLTGKPTNESDPVRLLYLPASNRYIGKSSGTTTAAFTNHGQKVDAYRQRVATEEVIENLESGVKPLRNRYPDNNQTLVVLKR